MLTDYTKAAGLLTASEDIAILCHRSPDGDTLGCGYALCLALLGLGKRARVLCSDPLPLSLIHIYKASCTVEALYCGFGILHPFHGGDIHLAVG